MDIKKEIVEKEIRRNRVEDFLRSQFERAGYSHSEIRRTPSSMKIIIYADKPGLVIGRGGKKINEVTEKLKEEFEFENPQLDIREVDKGVLNASIVAEEIANAIENGMSHRRIGNIMLRKIMEAGAVGAEIRVSGKLTSSRGRSERFVDGYLKYCGEPSKRLVDEAKDVAITIPGSIGVKVRIMKEYPQEEILKNLKGEAEEEIDESENEEEKK